MIQSDLPEKATVSGSLPVYLEVLHEVALSNLHYSHQTFHILILETKSWVRHSDDNRDDYTDIWSVLQANLEDTKSYLPNGLEAHQGQFAGTSCRYAPGRCDNRS